MKFFGENKEKIKALESELEEKEGKVRSLEGKLEEELAKRPRERYVQEVLTGAAEQLLAENAELAELAAKDKLTGLYNRRSAEEQITKLMAQLERPDERRDPHTTVRHITLGVFDIDLFKEKNDQYGHAGGDEVLKAVARTLSKRYSRDVDIVARWGGEEFVIAFRDADPDTILDKRFGRNEEEMMNGAMRMTVQIPDGREVPVTISGGLTDISAGESLDEAFKRADTALYAAKEGGRDRIVKYEEGLEKKVTSD